MHRWLIPLAAALPPWAVSIGAMAQEYCVTCAGPDATYRCVIGGEGPPGGHSSRGQFLCITELAKAGGHASCSAARGQATPCPGPTRTVMFQLADPGPGAPPVEAVAAPPAQPVAPVAPGQQLPPVDLPPADNRQPYAPPPQDTAATPAQPKENMVEELAGKTSKAVNDTGKAVGNAVKKSWDCVASLFGNC